MKLYPNWKTILKRAWSIRFNVLAALFSCAEYLLPYYSDSFPKGIFALLSILAIFGSNLSRIVFQESV